MTVKNHTISQSQPWLTANKGVVGNQPNLAFSSFPDKELQAHGQKMTKEYD